MQKYNGWKNFATWSIEAHIMNHQGLYTAWERREGPWTSAMVREFVLTWIPAGTPYIEVADYDSVDWDELAYSWSGPLGG